MQKTPDETGETPQQQADASAQPETSEQTHTLKKQLRPRPQYGELAPEGWQPPRPQPQQNHTAPGESGANHSAIPHNLGLNPAAGRAYQSSPTEQRDNTAKSGNSAKQRGAADKPPREASAAASAKSPMAGATPAKTPIAANPAVTAPGLKRAGQVDRVITIMLLVTGALGAYECASSMLRLRTTAGVLAQVIPDDGATIPSWVSQLGIIAAVGIIVLWTVSLLISIRRLSLKKLTFWVPLTTGIIAGVLVLVAAAVTIYSVFPAGMLENIDPEQLQSILNELVNRLRRV
ncbi:hypothetical protein KJY77_06185 [Canibacter sp. lx-72]|uniref:DUF6264 family protein n=1 Tax=Canibacter zhuwentaonis TaxID=2837491 RepID=UPI001BDD7986|nr:DUF6264 family protein [Canibacter zhuwentaonis]MBT1018717.1 hypothetical protein [Canibacter zhuwentaonis]MBT1035921.1 hypothetical protein [Canibacter zhuwentaonis]